MNKDCKKYLKQLKTLIPSAGRYERKFIQNMKNNLIEFASQNTNICYKDICERFGTPQDIIINYFENVDTEYLIQRLKISAIIRKCIICAVLIIAITCTIEAGLFYTAYQEAMEGIHGYWTETIY